MKRTDAASDSFAIAPHWRRRWLARVLQRYIRASVSALLMVVAVLVSTNRADSLEAIAVQPDSDRIEITSKGEHYEPRGDRFQVETVAAASGVSGRMTVAAQVDGSNPYWLVFALYNPTQQRIERWLTADRYAVVGSGAVWPNLDARRIEAVTPSIGFLPEPVKSERADVYRITVEPGQTITYVAELTSDRVGRIYLWKPLSYELKVRERQLFNGVLLGLTGLLAIFLTAIVGANHKVIFPVAALVAWCVLGYLCIEFGFFHKLFKLNAADNAVYRAAGEASIAASLVLFMYFFLRLGFGHSIVRMLFGVWILAQLSLVAIAVVDPRLAATFARLSFVLIGVVGGIATLYLAFRGQDRAISLIPTWLLFLVWIFAASVTLTGRMSGEVVVAGLIAGLVLVVLLIGFTVTQFAFRSTQAFHGAPVGEQQLQALAVDGARAATWEWSDRRNEIRVSPHVEAVLGLGAGELSTKVDKFVDHIKPSDRDKFKLTLWSVQERGGGSFKVDFRLRASDNSYRWYELEAASVDTADRRSIRCVGLLRDITDAKRSHERLLHDAVHCSLTGLPNRELFVDRLSVSVQRAMSEGGIRPTVLLIDIDKFKSVNSSMGLVVGDSLLLTVARRLQRHLGSQDTLARMGGDQFAILLLSQLESRDLAALAERIRRSLRSPITIAGREVRLTGSIGIAIYDGEEETPLDLLKEAEVAMYRAKRAGADRIEIFSAEMRGEPDDRVAIETELRAALEKNEIKVLYQPIVYLPTEELAGFEALVRWEHPTRGLLTPDAFIPVAEESELISQLGSYVLKHSVAALGQWQKILPRSDAPLFASVNISSRQLMSADLVQEVKKISTEARLRSGTLRLEITESLAMANPEQAVERMEQIRSSGAELALDDFGTGFSSLAYLQRFPIDTIKLDRMFVQRGEDGASADSAIVRSIVALAHELGKSVVAEGVEEARDAALLRSINCEFAQGYYYGEPMEYAEAIELLRVIRKSESRLKAQGFFRPKPKKPKDKSKTGHGARNSMERRRDPGSVAPNGTGQPRPAPDGGAHARGVQPPPAPHVSRADGTEFNADAQSKVNVPGANGTGASVRPSPVGPPSNGDRPSAPNGGELHNPPPALATVQDIGPAAKMASMGQPNSLGNRSGANVPPVSGSSQGSVSRDEGRGTEFDGPPAVPGAPGHAAQIGSSSSAPKNSAATGGVPVPAAGDLNSPAAKKPGLHGASKLGAAPSPVAPPPIPNGRGDAVSPGTKTLDPRPSQADRDGARGARSNGKAPSNSTNPSADLQQSGSKPSPSMSEDGNGLGAFLGGLPPLPIDAENVGNASASGVSGKPRATGAADALPPLQDIDEPTGEPTGEPTTGGTGVGDLSSLPPGIAASLARLAGSTNSGSGENQPRRLGDGGSVARPAGQRKRKGKGGKG